MAETSASFSNTMILRAEYLENNENHARSRVYVPFDRKLIIPEEYLRDTPSGYVVFPLHFMNNEYGYMVFNYGKGQWLNLFTHQYMNCLAASLDDIDKKSQLANAKRIEEMKEKTIPPKNPSQVFFGEILSFILCLPKKMPMMYAPISFIMTPIKT